LSLAAALALAEAWLGLTVAFYSDWPVSFCIAMLSAAGYFAALALSARRARHSRAGVIENAA
jgi:zinc/manganese transport system permease protein